MDLSTSYTIKAKVEGQNQIGKLETGLDKLKTSSNNAAGAMSKLKNAAGLAFKSYSTCYRYCRYG